jgi:hypothetical protein
VWKGKGIKKKQIYNWVFNELRAKYNFDDKISVSNQFANQNL